MAPFKEVKQQPDDAQRALIFFDFGCPVCAEYHERLTAWGSDLPRPWRAEFVPVTLPSKESALSSRAFFAVAAADPAKLSAFMAAAYRSVHNEGRRRSDPAMWREAVARAGVRGFDAAWARVSRRQLEASMAKLLSYGIDATPSIAIGGRFVVSPDSTHGDPNLFFQLANGMVSKAISY